eukprot:m.509242 g.509242  ORF g.509242 m.509242 type:complete len:258 (+) comp57397_c1_seq1:1-774(+)
MYSFTEFICVMILYYMGSNLSNWQYLYMDFFSITTLALCMGRTGAYAYISKERPPGSLLSPVVLVSLAVQIFIQAMFQAMALTYAQSEPWYDQPAHPDRDDDMAEYEGDGNTVIVLVSIFQYIALSIAFSKGKPYRDTIFSNYYYLVNVLILLVAAIYLNVDPSDGFRSNKFMLLSDDYYNHNSFQVKIGIMIIFNFILTIVVEKVVIANKVIRGYLKRLSFKKRYRNRYKDITRAIIESQWPSALIAKTASPQSTA